MSAPKCFALMKSLKVEQWKENEADAGSALIDDLSSLPGRGRAAPPVDN